MKQENSEFKLFFSGPTPVPTGPPTTTQEPQNVVMPQRDWEYMLKWATPNSGPVGEAPYVPGTPGAQWTNEEVLSTRLRIFQMIHPNWNVRKEQGTWNGLGPVTADVSKTPNRVVGFHT